MKYLFLLLPFTLIANIWVIQTEDYLGRIAIEKTDYIIVPSNHSLITRYNTLGTVVICDTLDCIENKVMQLNRKWRTKGISVIIIKD